MDTKSKKFKHSLWVKALCVIASSALIFGSVYFAAVAASTINFYGSLDVLKDKKVSYEDTYAFYNVAQQDLTSVATLASHMKIEGLDAEISSHKEQEVNAALAKYLAKKASIIESELYYVATNYDKVDDSYDEAYNRYVETTTAVFSTATSVPVPSGASFMPASNNSEDLSSSETATTEESTGAPKYNSIEIDPFAPKNVQVAQSILKNNSGLGFLEYESLVRSDAFSEQSFSYDSYFNLENGDVFAWNYNNYDTICFDLSQSDALEKIGGAFDSSRMNYLADIEINLSTSKANLDNRVNFKYIVEDASGKVLLTNIENAEKAAPDFKSHSCYMIFKDGTCEISGFDGYEKSNGGSGLANTVIYTVGKRDLTIIAYLDNPLAEGDMYYMLNQFLNNNASENVIQNIVFALIALAGAIMFLVFLLCLCGHKNEVEGYSISFIDRVPGDIHLLMSGVCVIGLGALAVLLGESFFSISSGFASYSYVVQPHYTSYNEYYTLILTGIAALCAGLWTIIIEWLTSLVRTVKAGRPYFKKLVVTKLIVWLFRLLKRLFRFFIKFFKKLNTVFSYKPKKFRRLLILAFAVYLLLNILFAAFLVTGNGASLFGFLLLAALNGFVLYKGLTYFKCLDEIIDAAGSENADIPDAAKMPESLKSLSKSIKLTQEELRGAVDKAVKDERTKTELITNVSHDLKTPLTAVISYVDLLKKCDITDETALGYINVLDEKSIKLKLLIEDLIEASKVSTGNVTLNPVGVNLTELAVQAIGEMNDLFEESNLELRLSEPKDSPVIFADSQKTFRIIDNLLNNARKYSENGSRVYVTVTSNDYYGIFEVKNISREPLNISPEELTERFVRGDKSRSNEGNGLGLSIAKDLCRLQNGKLVITIDGDLFKASVYLPLKDKFVFSANSPL